MIELENNIVIGNSEPEFMVVVSIAISLKRIADFLDRWEGEALSGETVTSQA